MSITRVIGVMVLGLAGCATGWSQDQAGVSVSGEIAGFDGAEVTLELTLAGPSRVEAELELLTRFGEVVTLAPGERRFQFRTALPAGSRYEIRVLGVDDGSASLVRTRLTDRSFAPIVSGIAGEQASATVRILSRRAYSLLFRATEIELEQGSGAIAGDVDNDGWSDLVIADHAGGIFAAVYHRNNGGGFDAGRVVGDGGRRMFLADLNGDGYADLVTAWGPGEIAMVVPGSADGPRRPSTWSSATLINGPREIIGVGELNNSGGPDLFVGLDPARNEWRMLDIFLNNTQLGTGSWRAVGAGYQDGGQYLSADDSAIGDFDRDGDNDIAIVGTNGLPATGVWLIKNNGGDYSVDYDAVSLPARGSGSPRSRGSEVIVTADFDQDGDLDLITAGIDYIADGDSVSKPATALLVNDGTGRFSAVQHSLPALQQAGVATADVDNDGDLDVLVSGMPAGDRQEITQLYLNESAGPDDVQFVPSGARLPAVYGGAPTFIDYDNDGDQDLVVAGMVGVVDGRRGTGPQFERTLLLENRLYPDYFAGQ